MRISTRRLYERLPNWRNYIFGDIVRGVDEAHGPSVWRLLQQQRAKNHQLGSLLWAARVGVFSLKQNARWIEPLAGFYLALSREATELMGKLMKGHLVRDFRRDRVPVAGLQSWRRAAAAQSWRSHVGTRGGAAQPHASVRRTKTAPACGDTRAPGREDVVCRTRTPCASAGAGTPAARGQSRGDTMPWGFSSQGRGPANIG